MSAVNLTIDGKEIAAEPGTTILQAARAVGIDIPTFCYDPELSLPKEPGESGWRDHAMQGHCQRFT